VHRETAITYRSRYFLFSLSFLPRSFVSLHSRPSFSHSSCPPSSHHPPSRGRLARRLFASGRLESLSRAHTPEADRLQRVLTYRHAVHSLECILHTVAGLKDGEESPSWSNDLSIFLHFIDCNDTGCAIEQRAIAILLLVCHLSGDTIRS